MKRVVLLIGVPGSGKSWVASQLTSQYKYLPHDQFITSDYLRAIVAAYQMPDPKPLLVETPFSITKFFEGLAPHGIEITPVFIIESKEVLATRYFDRSGKYILGGHLTRQKTYEERAKQLQSFSGTSQEVLTHLKRLGLES